MNRTKYPLLNGKDKIDQAIYDSVETFYKARVLEQGVVSRRTEEGFRARAGACADRGQGHG